MSIGDASVTRLYGCESCECEIAYKQLVKEKWKKKCPMCGKHTLVLKSADISMNVLFDVSVPKTLGSLAEHNSKKKVSEEGKDALGKPKEVPWWRKNKKKVDFSVLKNPQKYIQEGKV
jgi:predicted RNA-binding Zn-ribbon protein involved in translation (DUF1610 family)